MRKLTKAEERWGYPLPRIAGGEPTATEPTLLEKLQERKADIGKEWDELIDAREKERSDFEARQGDEDAEKRPSDTDVDAFNSAEKAFEERCEKFREQVEGLNERIKLQEEQAERKLAAEKASSNHASVTSEPAVYREDNADEVSYLRDLILTEPSWKGRISRDWGAAEERLKKHGKEIEDVLPKRELERQRRAEKQIEDSDKEFRTDLARGMRRAGHSQLEVRRLVLRGGIDESPFERSHYTTSEQRANPSRQPGAGGEFVPPTWLIDEYLMYLRAARTIAPLCRNLEVPAGTNTVKLPKIEVPTEVAPQLLDNAGVASRDIKTGYTETAFKTLSGQEDVAIQLIEQSPGQIFDRVVMEDLIADYNLRVDQNLSYASGNEVANLAGGTIKGLYPATNWGANENESSNSEKIAAVYFAAWAANWSQIARKRYSTEGIHHIMNPRRIGYLASLLDGSEGKSGRPVINSRDFPNFNTAALMGDTTPPEGLMFQTPLGPNVYGTNNIHTKDNGKGVYTEAGTNDYLLTGKFDDVWFFESDLRTRVLPEVASGTLQVRFQCYAYVGSLVRYGQSLAVAYGKPFEAPTGFGFTF
jgi:HK97 family phage major capsid protein